MTTITAWSYSRFAKYELCPAQFKYAYIDKLPTTGSPAMARGDKIHRSIASFVMGGIALESDAVKHAFPAKLIKEVRDFEDKVVEQQWGFTARWEPTGWFGKDTWFRNIVDAAVLYDDLWTDCLDWKTGKRYASNADQMELNALAMMRHFKPATGVTTRMVYIDSGEEDTSEFKRSDEPLLMAKWEKKVEPMFTDTAFLPRPNDKCRFCDFSRSSGGPCRFG